MSKTKHASLMLLLPAAIYLTAVLFPGCIKWETRSERARAGFEIVSHALGVEIKNEIEKLLAYGLKLSDIEDLGLLLHEITVEYQDLSHALVVDRNGRILFHSDSKQVGGMFNEMYPGAGGERSSQRVVLWEEKEHFHAVFPLRDKRGAPAGILVIGAGVDSWKAAAGKHPLEEFLWLKGAVIAQEPVKEIKQIIDFGLALEDIGNLSENCLRLSSRHTGLIAVMVLNREMVIVAHSIPAREGMVVEPELPGELEEGKSVKDTVTLPDGEQLRTAVPFFDNRGGFRGAVVVSLSPDIGRHRVSTAP